MKYLSSNVNVSTVTQNTAFPLKKVSFKRYVGR